MEINFEKGRSLVDLAPDMVYNGIAYEIKRLAERVLLRFESQAKPMHQDADTS